MSAESNDGGSHEVVISPGDGLDKEHAELLRKRLLDDGFHDHAVSVRDIDPAQLEESNE